MKERTSPFVSTTTLTCTLARPNGRRRHQRRLNHAVVTCAAAQIGRGEEEVESRSVSLSFVLRNPLSRLDTFT